MSTCIYQNCDEATVHDRPTQPTGILMLSQLYCPLHLEEAQQEAEVAPQEQPLYSGSQ